MRKVSTLLVDPDRLCREGLAKLLEDSPYEVAGQVASIDEAIDEVASGKEPELCLISYALGDKEEVELVSKLRDSSKDTRIVVLCTLRNARLLAQSLEAGVDAFLLKDMSAESLERALGLVMIGEKVMPTQLASLLVKGKLNSFDMPTTDRKFRELIRQSSGSLPNVSHRIEAVLRRRLFFCVDEEKPRAVPGRRKCGH